jgi:hypothetical protein
MKFETRYLISYDSNEFHFGKRVDTEVAAEQHKRLAHRAAVGTARGIDKPCKGERKGFVQVLSPLRGSGCYCSFVASLSSLAFC